MALEFPPGFPSAFVEPLVIAARIGAECEFRDEAAAGKAGRSKAAR